jgi:hypothetical protein
MKKFKTEVLKTRMLADAKQTTINITNDNGEFEIDEIQGIVDSFEASANKKGDNLKTIVRIPTILGPRTVKMFSGDWKLEEYEEYWSGKVAENGKFEKISYIEVTVIKAVDYNDYFA